jgi:hypothetical protein
MKFYFFPSLTFKFSSCLFVSSVDSIRSLRQNVTSCASSLSSGIPIVFSVCLVHSRFM